MPKLQASRSPPRSPHTPCVSWERDLKDRASWSRTPWTFAAGGAASPATHNSPSTETNDVSLVYLQPTQTFIVPHVGRSFENAFAFHQKLFDFKPREKITVLLTDFSDAGNASADAVPRDFVTLRIAPMNFAFETFTASERMSYLMNHELVHVFTSDRPAPRDRMFRQPVSRQGRARRRTSGVGAYLYLTAPRRASPRWYMEGIAVFLDTWMAGGLGRAQGRTTRWCSGRWCSTAAASTTRSGSRRS